MTIDTFEKNAVGQGSFDLQGKLGALHKSFGKGLDRKLRIADAAIELSMDTVGDLNKFFDGTIDGKELAVDSGRALVGMAGEFAAGQEGKEIATEFYEIGIDYFNETDTRENLAERLENLKIEINEQAGQGELAMTAAQFAVNSYDVLVDWREGNIDGTQAAYNIGEHAAYSLGEYLGGEEWANEAVALYEVVVEQGGEIIENIGEAAGEIADNISEAASNVADGVSEKLDAAANKTSKLTNAAKAKLASIFD